MVSFWTSEKDHELSELKRNHRLAIQSQAKIEQQLSQATEQQSKAEQESTALKLKNAALEQELQACRQELLACRDDLFRLQPTNHIPDSKIAGQSHDLVGGIGIWIDAEVSRFSDKWQERCPGVPPRLFHHGGNKWVGELLGEHSETAGELLIQCIIQRQLYKYLFAQKIYLFGLSLQDSMILQLAEREMQQLQPPRGE